MLWRETLSIYDKLWSETFIKSLFGAQWIFNIKLRSLKWNKFNTEITGLESLNLNINVGKC
jgi:hypothetical protein